jgi:uncharacterized protein (DUF1499 family)
MSQIERPSENSARATAVYDRDPQDILAAAEQAVASLSNWSLAYRSGTILRAVRSTSLLRFKDDVTVTAEPGHEPGQGRLEVASASRVGKSDFGQKPRNLRELLEALDAELR